MTRNPLQDHQIFWREFRDNFHTTGAVLPSSRWLATALTRYVRRSAGGLRILEAGPGTGVVTRQIVRRMGPLDQLDLVELNDTFVSLLRQRFREDPRFRAVAEQARVIHQSVTELPSDDQYDVIVSGLPLNNFDVDQVASILGTYRRLLRPGGTLSFFEYIGVRPVRRLVGKPVDRRRLHGITRLLRETFEHRAVRREWIWANVPPAWVHHVRLRPVSQATSATLVAE